MSGDAALEALLAEIPLFAGRRVQAEPLAGGLSNSSWRIDDGAGRFVLRISSGARAGGGGHALEIAIQQRAADAGIAPALCYADAARGILVSEFVPGRPLDDADLREPAVQDAVGRLLRQLHALPACGVAFDAAGAAASYRARLRHCADTAFADRCVAIVAEPGTARCSHLCHNDVVGANVIGSNPLQLIDFEYAADHEPLFDVASLVGWHNLDDNAAGRLLRACAGSVSPEVRERFRQQLRRFDALQWLWLSASPPARVDSAVAERQLLRARSRLGGA